MSDIETLAQMERDLAANLANLPQAPPSPNWAPVNPFSQVVRFFKLIFRLIGSWMVRPLNIDVGSIASENDPEKTGFDISPIIYGVIFLIVAVGIAIGCFALNVVAIGIAWPDPDPVFVPIIAMMIDPITVYAFVLTGLIGIFGSWFFDTSLLDQLKASIFKSTKEVRDVDQN